MAVVLHAVWPAARRRLGIVTPLLALVGLVFVPITTHAGEWLENKGVDGGRQNPLIRHHAQLGHQLLPFAAVLFLVAIGVWLLGRFLDGASVPLLAPATGAPRTAASWLVPVAGVVSVVVGLVTVVWLYRIGDSGAKAVVARARSDRLSRARPATRSSRVRPAGGAVRARSTSRRRRPCAARRVRVAPPRSRGRRSVRRARRRRPT